MDSNISFLLIALSSLGFLISCHNDNSKKYDLPILKDSTPNLTIITGKNKQIIDTLSVISSKQIVGAWENLGKEPLTVDITKNTISYREHNESHNFKLKSGSIYIHYPDLTLSGRPYLIKDTFVISMVDGEIKYVRLKK